MNGKPTHCKGRHQEGNQAEDLPLASLLSSRLVWCPVARSDTLLQFDSDTEVRHKDSRKRQDVRDQQGAVCIHTSLFLFVQPEFLTDVEAFLFELHMVCVCDGGGHQAAGQQPDAGQDAGAGRHRGTLLQGMNCCIISAVMKEQALIIRETHGYDPMDN